MGSDVMQCTASDSCVVGRYEVCLCVCVCSVSDSATETARGDVTTIGAGCGGDGGGVRLSDEKCTDLWPRGPLPI